jgi:CRP/FNR family transcriptional regulator, anaerobic regulatory protein
MSPTAFNTIFGGLSRISPVSPEAANAMASCFTLRALQKKDHWLRAGDICDSIVFIWKGCLRIYFPFEDGTIRTSRFFFEGGWVSDYESVNCRRPANLGIDALEYTELYEIKMKDIQFLYNRFPELERVGRLIAEANVVDLCSRYRSLLHDTPLTRYLRLVASQPEVVDRIPQHYIASYLGIEPESLSRIRRKIASEAPLAQFSV